MQQTIQSLLTQPLLGANYLGNGQTAFLVWAPAAKQVEVCLLGSPTSRIVPLKPHERGYFYALLADVAPGSRYLYRLDGQKERPDPASRFQPDGVHQASQVIDPQFAWNDAFWAGLALQNYIIYELHVGTFTAEGTFEAIIPHLKALKDLGITALELMPVAQFPGSRNWGYDGVYPSAVQNSYGGPEGLKRLVAACHQEGLAVVLDVVYNHLGPEGNYLWDYGPYFTDRYNTPWGEALNFDGPYSDEVRRFFLENILLWLTDYHFDALRLDAIHAIKDFSAQPFLQEAADLVHQLRAKQNRQVYLIGETNQNDVRVIKSKELGGLGLDTQWSDDFHHAVHTLLTNEGSGYYQDFVESDSSVPLRHLAKAFREGYAFSGEFSPFRNHRYGNSARDLAGEKFVISIQNHDQVGNRMFGERLSQLVSFEKLKLAAGLLLLAPNVPMLFMGEEYGEIAPFLYFISHSDENLVKAVQQGRKDEFKEAFALQGEPPDPQAEETFQRSKLNRSLLAEEKHSTLLNFHKTLLELRKTLPALSFLSKDHQEITTLEAERLLLMRRWVANGEKALLAAFNFGDAPQQVTLPLPKGRWLKILDSAAPQWGPTDQPTTTPAELEAIGNVTFPLAAHAFVLLGHKKEQ